MNSQQGLIRLVLECEVDATDIVLLYASEQLVTAKRRLQGEQPLLPQTKLFKWTFLELQRNTNEINRKINNIYLGKYN